MSHQKDDGFYTIKRLEQIEALVSQVRQEIVDVLLGAPPLSMRELARIVGRTPDSLYYHVRKLVEVGLLVEGGTRRTARREEALFQVVHPRLRLLYDHDDPAKRQATVRVLRGAIRMAQRDFETGFAAVDVLPNGPRRNLWGDAPPVGSRRRTWRRSTASSPGSSGSFTAPATRPAVTGWLTPTSSPPFPRSSWKTTTDPLFPFWPRPPGPIVHARLAWRNPFMSAVEPQDPAPGLEPPSDVNPCREPALDFPDRDFGTLSAGDYRAIGFMSGLEVHQQLRTRTKLFCRCPAGVYVDHYDAEVLRHMRPTLSELGEYDGTALMEFKTHKEIVYLLERGTVCTYEIDDTPPFVIDEEAVRVALEISMLFNLNLVSELHVMRKQYLDGSIPTGFQRTAMMGLAGTIPFREPALGVDRELTIRQLSLEEDACREVSDVGHRVVFRTDRLGMPLTEVVTEPELLTPLELQAGARLIARITRASDRVRRGPGAARQDVNVSVAGGRRTEIKGVDNHRHLPRLVHIEGFRQLNLLRIRAELARRGVTAGALPLPDPGKAWETSALVTDATAVLRRSDFAPVRDVLDRGEFAAAVRLPGFGGLLTHRTQPGVTFAGEFAGRARVIACLTARPFLIHSDIPGYGLGSAEWKQLRTALRARPEDVVVAVWGPERDVDTAVREILIRAREALVGVPAETRQAFPDGTTGFERILPGADRMYPDTDTPPVPIPDAWVTEIRERLPRRPFEREAELVRAGLDPAAARRLVDAPWAGLFAEAAPQAGTPARRLAAGLAKLGPRLRRDLRPAALPPAERLAPAVRALERGEFRPEALDAVLARVATEPEVPAERILDAYRPRGTEAHELAALVAGTAERAPGLAGKSRETVLRWAMGRVMPALLGRMDPLRVEARLAETLSGTWKEDAGER